MAEITKEQLEEWAQCVYENCGEGDSFNNSLYSIVMEMRDLSGYYNAQQNVQRTGLTAQQFSDFIKDYVTGIMAQITKAPRR